MYKFWQYFCSICLVLLGLTGCGNQPVLTGAKLCEPIETSMAAETAQSEREGQAARDGQSESEGQPESGDQSDRNEMSENGGLSEESQDPEPAEESSRDGRVNINTASCEELMTLYGIGQVRAEAVIAYRDTYGAFQKPEDIMKVYGIGEGIYRRIKEKITVK